MLRSISRGFNLIKIYELENTPDIIFSTDITSDINLDLNLVALDDQKCVSSKTKVQEYFHYNEALTLKTYSIKIDKREYCQIYVSFHSQSATEIKIENIQTNKLLSDSTFEHFIPFNFDQFKNRTIYPTWQQLVEKEINFNNNSSFDFPLIDNTYDKDDILSMMDVLISNKLTMGQNVLKFEEEFARYVGAKYAIMVNSGSSANLLAMAVASNHSRKIKLNAGDKIIVPTVCWSTSVWPIIQMNLIPVFVDIDPMTMNMNINELQKILKNDTNIKGIVAIHILGNSTNMDQLMKIVQDHKLFLMEDTCESLGSTYNGQMLGTFGHFGTFSFYYSHHITTIEGGMVVCNDEDDFELLKCLRSHGWTRYLKNKEELEKLYHHIDPRFLFVNVGYNLRPMETQGAMGLTQLSKLDKKNKARIYNHDKVVDLVLNDPRNKNIFYSPHATAGCQPAWFSLSFILHERLTEHYKPFLTYLTENKVENRPIVTGNFAQQPIFKQMNLNDNPDKYQGAQVLHHRGFFIGLSCQYMDDSKINKLVNIFFEYKFD